MDFGRPLPVPTDALPGSAAKVEVLRLRWLAGQQLHSPLDARLNYDPAEYFTAADDFDDLDDEAA